MNTLLRVVSILWSLLLFVSCGIDHDTGSSSTLRLQLPSSFSGVSKAATSSDINALNAKPCFAIGLSGAGIPETGGDLCNPKQGQFIGWVQGGEIIELEVQRGSDRTLDVFYMGAESCSSVDSATVMGEMGSNFVHRLGQKTGINLDQAQVDVMIKIQVPSVANTLDRVYGLPKSCRKGNENLLAESRDARAVSGAVSGRLSSGIGISLRMAPSTIDVVNSGRTVRIKPHRLGVTE